MKRTIFFLASAALFIYGAYHGDSPHAVWFMFCAGAIVMFECVCRVFKQDQYARALHVIDELVRGENLYGRNHQDPQYQKALDEARRIIRSER